MKPTTRTRLGNIHNYLNKNKIRSLKLLSRAIQGEEVLTSQIQAAKATLELLRAYEPGRIDFETANQ